MYLLVKLICFSVFLQESTCPPSTSTCAQGSGFGAVMSRQEQAGHISDSSSDWQD